LANSFQPSQADVSVEDFLGFSEFKEAVYEEEFTALRGSPTVSGGFWDSSAPTFRHLANRRRLFLYCIRRVAMYPLAQGVQLTRAPGLGAWGFLCSHQFPCCALPRKPDTLSAQRRLNNSSILFGSLPRRSEGRDVHGQNPGMRQGRSIERVSARGARRDGRGGPHESGRACEGTWHSGSDARAHRTSQSEHPRRLAELRCSPVSMHDDRLPAVHGAGLTRTIQVRSRASRSPRTPVCPAHPVGIALRSALRMAQPLEKPSNPGPVPFLPDTPTRKRAIPWPNHSPPSSSKISRLRKPAGWAEDRV
jgi:hypothetical protein